MEELEKEITAGKELRKVKQEVQAGLKEHLGFTIAENKLMNKGRYVIPRNSKIISALIPEYHDRTAAHMIESVGGHLT